MDLSLKRGGAVHGRRGLGSLVSLLGIAALLALTSRAAADIGCAGAAPAADPALQCALDADTTDPVVVAKAAELGGDIDQILDFVREQVRFESYPGSLRGARGTLWSGAGNALDKANLAVALLRVSGVPARYVRGTLSAAQSAGLVGSMFPVVTRVVGCPPPGTPRSQPSSDPALLAEVADHFWIEAKRGAVFEPVDLTMPGAPPSGDVGTRTATFTTVDDALRHHVTLRLVVETMGTGLANGTRTETVVEERFATAELVGKPATFGHEHVEAVSGSLFGAGILTYQPYLLVDGGATGQDAVLLPGTEYQEVSLGVMHEFVTLLSAEFDLESPDGSVEHHSRDIIDRLGAEAREGVSDVTITAPGGLEPTVTEFDQLTVNVLPGLQDPAPILGQEARITPLADEFTALLPTLEAIQAAGVQTTQDSLDVAHGGELAAGLIRLSSQTLVMSMAGASDRVMSTLDPALLTRGYFDSPRLIVALSRYSSEGVVLKLDLRRTAARTIPYPDQVADQGRNYEFVRGLIDSATESELMKTVAAGPVHSTVEIFQAMPEGMGLLEIDPGSSWLLDTLDLDGDAMARMRAALARGDSVLVPNAMVPFDGGSDIAWFEIDGITNSIIGVTGDGGHQAAIGYGLLVRNNVDAGTLIPGFANGFTGGILSFLGGFLAEINSGNGFEAAVRAGKDKAAQVARDAQSQIGGWAKRGVKAGFATASFYISHVLPVDPAVQAFLSVPFDDTIAPPTSGEPVDVEIRHDPLYYVDIDGAQLPTVYRAAMRNAGAGDETYDIDFASGSPDFTVVSSASHLTLGAGEVGEVGVCLFPNAGVPPVGPAGTVSVAATGQGNPGASAGDDMDVVTPDVHGLSIAVDPALVSGAPGTSVPFDLVVTATGNVGETATIAVTAPAGWSVSGLPASVTLAAGEERHLAGSVAVPAGAALGESATLALSADPCGSLPPGTCTLELPSARVTTLAIEVHSAAVSTISNAGLCATAEGEDALGAALALATEAAAAWEEDPASTVACLALRQRQAALCPLLSPLSLLDGVTAALCPVATNEACDANTVTDFQAAVAPLCGVLPHRLVAQLLPSGTYSAPGTPAASVLRLQNAGSSSSTVDVTVAIAEGGLDLGGAPAQVTVAPGATVDVPLTLDAAAAGSYAYALLATPVEAPAAQEAVQGVHTATTSMLSVLQVTGAPPYIFPGGTTQVHAAVANTVNTALAAKATVTIRRPDNSVRYQSPAPVLLSIPAEGNLDLALDFVTATGWDDGVYAIEVAFADADGNPIPGGSGAGQLPVGQPLRASVVADPISVPPGTSEVTARIEVESTLEGLGAGSVPPTDPTVNRIDWAAASRGASIGGPAPWSNAPASILIDEQASNTESWIGNSWAAGESLVLDLGDVRSFDTLQLHLWDGDDRYFQYQVEVSEDGVAYSPLVDATTGEHRGLERHVFAPVSGRYLRFQGTFGDWPDNGFYLIDEILVIGNEATTAQPTTVVTVDAVDDGGSSAASGQSLALHAGTYIVTHVGGAVSLYPGDADNNGRTWTVNLRADVPVANKSYQIGHVNDAITAYGTSAEAEAASLGRSFKLVMPVDGVVHFWLPDGFPSDNRGSQQFEVRQVSGPDESLTARVRDAIMRGALWEQPAIAGWQNWLTATDYGCLGCHEQTQATVGLEVSRLKVSDTPVDERLTRALIEGFKTWQDAGGWVSPQHNGDFDVVQTSLWAWAVSHYRGSNSDELAAPLLRALDWVVGVQDAGGAWTSDHQAFNSSDRLYWDGDPSATLTASSIQALVRGLQLVDGQDIVPFADVTISDNRVLWSRNPGLEADLLLAPAGDVTAVRLSVAGAFSYDSNFVLGEVEFFDGDTPVPVVSAEADFEQADYPISETFDGITRSNDNGWAHWPVATSVATPARAVWRFAGPVHIDRVRIHQPYSLNARGRGFQVADLSVDISTAPSPTLADAYVPVGVTATGLHAGDRTATYTESIRRAARALAAPSWVYDRNTRTTAQTVIGLVAARPFLEGVDLVDADARLAEAVAQLRDTQQDDGGWNDTTGPSRAFQTAQALEALVETSGSTTDPAIIAGAEFLLQGQRPDGRWLSPPLVADTPGATTWVQIALPALFENLAGLTIDVRHDVATTDNPIVEGSIVPAPDGRIAGAGEEEVHWSSLLVGSEPQKTFTLRTRVTGLAPGETRQVGNGGTVDFTSLAGSGQLVLGPISVSARHVLSIAPASVTEAPGGSADYVLTVENVTTTTDNFALSIAGVDPLLSTLPASVSVPAGQTVDVPFLVSVPGDMPEGDIALRVEGSSDNGIDDSAGAMLLVRGPAVSVDDTPVQAVHVEIAPADVAIGRGMGEDVVVRVTNLGDAPDTFALTGLFPADIGAVFDPDSVFVLPGIGNARETLLHLGASADAAAASGLPMSVTATSTTEGSVHDTADGTIDILGLGVDVTLTPTSGPAGSTFEMHVRNTGVAADSFALALSGPLADPGAPVAVLAAASVTDLAAGEETIVTVDVGTPGFAVAGGLPLTAIATSTSDARIRDEDTAEVVVAGTHGIDLALDPECQAAAVDGGVRDFALEFLNLGNAEEVFDLAVTATTGDVSAHFVTPDGTSQAVLTGIRLPGLASALAGVGASGLGGSFTVSIQGSATVAGSVTGRIGCDVVTTTTTTSTTTTTMEPLACAFDSNRSTSIRKEGTVAGDLSVNIEKGKLKIDKDVDMAEGTIVTANWLKVGKNASVHDVQANRLLLADSAVVHGIQDTIALPLAEVLCSIVTPDCGSGELEVTGTDGVMTPGVYGDLVLTTGSRLLLQPGEYRFCSIRSQNRVELALGEGEVTVRVVDKVKLGQANVIGDDTHRLRLEVAGKQVKLGKEGQMHASVIAPLGKLQVGTDSTLSGESCSDRLSVAPRSQLRCQAP